MVPKVRMALEKIAEKFINYLGDDVFVEDVVLMGSLANYNWSEFSDFDLHVIIDFQQYEKEAELFKELFDLKKKDFNSNHDIRIFGYDVELYAQGSDEPNASTAVYSIMNDEWLKVPQKEDLKIDLDYLKTKIKCWTQKIDDAIQDKDLDKLSNLKEKIKKYRQSGLEKEGEFSYENLVFKFLRRSGHIEDLFDTINKVEDKELSVENKLDS
jgi:predicted nucleotidyltransferase